MRQKFPVGTQYIISIVTVVFVAALGYFIQDLFGYRSVALLLLLAVSVLAMLFQIWPVLIAACLSALIWDFFFIPPRFTLTVSSAEDLLLLLMYFAIVVLNAVLTYKVRLIEKESREKAEQEKSIALYNALLNSLSHELRTPIATIIGATDTLKENEASLSEKTKRDLIDEVSKASLRLDRHVGNLLNMSRLQSGIIKPRIDWIDVNELLHNVARKLEKDAAALIADGRITVDVESSLPLVKVDTGLLEQAIYNILYNALLYTPLNSKIIVKASSESFIEQQKSTGLECVKHYLVITISDNGPGFPADEMDKVFDKFYRLRNSKTGGTGLGLSISKGFIEAHNGTITLKNLPTGGAEFIVRIPVEITHASKLKHE